MSGTDVQEDAGLRRARALGLLLVAAGLLNTLPTIPGLDDGLRTATGLPWLTIRKFPYEFFFPLSFLAMMLIVVLRHSFARDFGGRPGPRRLAARAMDAALVIAAAAISLAYLIEIDSVCLIDQISGERAALIERALAEEREFAELYGLPIPDSVDDPSCIVNLGGWIFAIVPVAIAVFLAYNVKVWGLPLVAVSILVALYTVGTVAVWYVWGADDMNRYLVTKLGGEPRLLMDGRPNVEEILVNNAQGLLGRFMNILLNTVFPYIVLGTLFGASAGGRSLIKLAFVATRKLRGGPAHAAIVSSALFGTISGGPVVNVLSTGVLTIPMMLRRGFDRTFAGGVEAAASSGGQIMPPVMGVAAFVLAALTATPYREVIIAAATPAIAYFGCLFLTVVFQARKQGIEAQGELDADMRLSREDALHLVMIFAPILLILFLLITPKEAVGCGFFGALLGAVVSEAGGACRVESLPWVLQLVQNSAGDAGSAGWWAAALLAALFFLDPAIRSAPSKLVRALAEAGVLVGTLYLMFLAVSVIDFCLNFTGLSGYLARDIIFALGDFGDAAGRGAGFLFVALLVTMLMAVLLGMGMPTVPAYINVALLMAPVLTGLGIATFTANMFIFYFAVASAITPPVAVAAFAAASITGADPMATGLAAVKAGIVMFVIPFVFAFHPQLLLIPAAQLTPGGGGVEYLPGLDGTVAWGPLGWLMLRLSVGLYLLASVLSRFDVRRLGPAEMALRLAAAGCAAATSDWIGAGGLAAGLALIAAHRLRGPARATAA